MLRQVSSTLGSLIRVRQAAVTTFKIPNSSSLHATNLDFRLKNVSVNENVVF